jgi:60 kDa SS-A/Ro ribonucleoprotein
MKYADIVSADVPQSEPLSERQVRNNAGGFVFAIDDWVRLDRFLTPLAISPRQRLTDAVKAVSNLPFGGTDCALPMLYALEQGIEVDAFFVYTDNETWAGAVHPAKALRHYRQKTGIPAKLVVVGLTSTGFSIADPNDAGMLDVVGFDAGAPAVMADFVR